MRIPFHLFLAMLAFPLGIVAQNPVSIPPVLSGDTLDLVLQNGTMNWYPGAPTSTMGVNGNLLGPTLVLDRGQQVTLRVDNQLGMPSTVHWHGMHVSPENDGGPHNVIAAGSTWSPSFTVKDWAATYWYHPHLHMHTNEHAQKGIAGLVIVRDSVEGALTLPRSYGVDDFPLVIQSRAFDGSNQIVVESALDTALMVNGTLDPVLAVPAQVVRLRVLNGGSERAYNLGLTANRTFHMIASDGGLLGQRVPLTRLQLFPGERAEVLIDLSGLQGQSLDLMAYNSELPNAIYGAAQPGMGMGQTIPNYASNPLNGNDYAILRLDVGAPTANPVSSLPGVLAMHNPWTATQAQATRTLTFTPVNMGPTAIQGPFLINNQPFDMNVINYQVPFENIEIWELTNQSPIGHPFHIHDVQFYVLDINGAAPPAHLAGRKDVIHVPAGMGTVRFITRFEDFHHPTVPYMYHCHMLTHEDDGMMGQFLVLPPCLPVFTASPISQGQSVGGTATFTVSVSDTTAPLQWQADTGFGFQNLSNAGQFSGVNTTTLQISNLTAANHNSWYRCVAGSGNCTDTTAAALLYMVLNERAEVGAFAGTWLHEGALHGVAPRFAGQEWTLVDLGGRVLRAGKLESPATVLGMDGLPSGMYVLRAMGGAVRCLK